MCGVCVWCVWCVCVCVCVCVYWYSVLVFQNEAVKKNQFYADFHVSVNMYDVSEQKEMGPGCMFVT